MRAVLAFTIFFGLMIGFWIYLANFNCPLYMVFLIATPAIILGSFYVYMTFFISADFFPMLLGRVSKGYERYVKWAKRGEARLRNLLKRLSIPPPLGDESLRDKTIEDLIYSGDLQTAEDILSQKVHSYASNPDR